MVIKAALGSQVHTFICIVRCAQDSEVLMGSPKGILKHLAFVLKIPRGGANGIVLIGSIQFVLHLLEKYFLEFPEHLHDVFLFICSLIDTGRFNYDCSCQNR